MNYKNNQTKLSDGRVKSDSLRSCYVRIAVTKQTQLVDILDVLLFLTTNTKGKTGYVQAWA